MPDISRIAQHLLAHSHEYDLDWNIGVSPDHPSLRLITQHGFAFLYLDTDEDEPSLVWTWRSLATGGHRVRAAANTLLSHNERDTLAGVFYLRPASADDPEPTEGALPALGDGDEPAVFNPGDLAEAERDHYIFYATRIRDLDDLTDEALGDAAAVDLHNLGVALDIYEKAVAMRTRSDAAEAAHDADWPAARDALLDDTTSASMLGIIFGRFEENSVHSYVFSHPGADVALRHRIVASWNAIAADDRAHPFGDPDAPSHTFAEDRLEAIAALTEGD